MKSKIKIGFVSIFAILLTIQSLSGQDEILFRKHVFYSATNGLFYGVALDLIAELGDGAATGLPVISAGVSALIPILSKSSRTTSSNSMILSDHGKFIGWSHGFALASLIGGENAWNSENYKITLGVGMAASIGLGILGNSLGKDPSLTEGQVALYRYYGWIGPFTGVSLMAATTEDVRLYGASVLLFGAGGYLLADRVYRWHQYTRGDIRSTQVLALLNAGLGYGILADKVGRDNTTRSDLLFPAIGILTGTLVGHLWLKDTDMSLKQGMQTAFAATGGAVLGLGIALLTESRKATPYYLIPYLTGLGAYTFAVENIRKKNNSAGSESEKQLKKWEIAFMPQNVILNSKMKSNIYTPNGMFLGMQPLFAASYRF
jgi:hypothetical protein